MNNKAFFIQRQNKLTLIQAEKAQLFLIHNQGYFHPDQISVKSPFLQFKKKKKTWRRLLLLCCARRNKGAVATEKNNSLLCCLATFIAGEC